MNWYKKAKNNILTTKRSPSDYNSKELEMGKKEELEHTEDKNTAREIAMDHLDEFPDNYYTELKKMEEKIKD